MYEFDCQRCGIHVIHVVGEPHPEIVYCAPCRFIESLETEEQKRAASEMLDRREVKNDPDC